MPELTSAEPIRAADGGPDQTVRPRSDAPSADAPPADARPADAPPDDARPPGPPEADPAEVFAAFVDAGLWTGLGRTTAANLPDAGIRVASDVDPGSLTRVKGVSAARARRLAETFVTGAGTFAVVELLLPAGVPARLARRVTEELGPGAAGILRSDPWRLLDAGEADVGQADRLARAFGLRRDDPRRGPSVLVHLLARAARAGDTAAPGAALLRAAVREGVVDPPAALATAAGDGRVVVDGDLVALDRYAMAEESLAEGLVRLAATAEPLTRRAAASRSAHRSDGRPDDDDHEADEESTDGDGAEPAVTGARGDLDEAQRRAVAVALESGVSLLTGGPGTGKSHTVAEVIRLARAANARIALAAPTGRAAKRLEELAGSPASTLHRLLQAQGAGGGFGRDEHNPVEADLVVVDEASMLDVELASALLDACADGTHLLLVGDPAQLPSIGPGRVLGDLIDAGTVPVTELRTLYRQAAGGAIARLATSIRDGDLPPPPPGGDREVVVVTARDSGEAAHRAVQLVTDSIPRALGIPADEVQVVTPVHKGPAGTLALNAALKKVLNPGTGTVGGFDVGDRVVSTANHLDEGFANGEIGLVTGIGDKSALRVAFSSGTVEVPANIVGDLRHGWAVTAHRAQGSEWPAVVAVVPPEAAGMLSRPLVYTAITRARAHLSIVTAVGPSLRRAVREVGGRRRCTLLAGMLAGDPDGGGAGDGGGNGAG